MELNDLLTKSGIDPSVVLALRHRPTEPELNRVFDMIAGERPDLFNAYQQTQTRLVENAMHGLQGRGFIASFVRGDGPEAVFVGLYSIAGSKPITRDQFWRIPANIEMRAYGMHGFGAHTPRKTVRKFQLEHQDFHKSWKGRLVVGWPPPMRGWWRRAHKNKFPVLAILPESKFSAGMPQWDEIDLKWGQLSMLPKSWEAALSQWRGVYHIFDASDGKGYVGAAYGSENILGRWRHYAASGHGGNRQLKQRDPRNFQFTILQRVSPDMPTEDVTRLERTWKLRLHTRHPYGLNDN